MPGMRARAASLAIALLAGASPESSAQLSVAATCPQKIEVEQRVAALPQGWEAGQVTTTAALASVTFFHGPPAAQAPLKPNSEDRQKRDRIVFWNLSPSARGYWISCGYANTAAVISRRLPDSVKTCSVTYERRRPGGGGQPAIKRMDCK